MNIVIERKSIETLLFGILSCHCPVTEETERALFAEFRYSPPEEFISLTPFLKIADRNPEKTPLHLFMDFCFCNQPDPQNFIMTHDDVVRYFSSKYHFNRILASIDPLTITHPPGHLVGHMLIPVKLENRVKNAEAHFGGKTVRFKNLFLPPEINASPDTWLGLHLGMIITSMSDEQALMAQAHLNLIQELADLAGWIDEVDYAQYQSFGDYRAYVKSRYARHF